MDRSSHTLSCLFAQLGLENSDTAIEKFIKDHKGLPARISLSEADIWNVSQASFLREAIEQDSDWSEVVDSLDARLR